MQLFQGLLGLLVFPFLAWLMSSHKRLIMWKTVGFGLTLQIVLGALVMLTPPGQALFMAVNEVIVGLLEFSNEGARFLFGKLVDQDFALAQFAFSVLPTIIFFSSLMSIFYYSGIMQKIVEFIAWIMMKLLGTSGAETLAVSSNIFVGQTESPLVVKPFIDDMTRSELATIMTGGFATVAGGVMAAYVGMIQEFFPKIAGHLLTASIMSAPAAIVMSKLAFPETQVPETRGGVSTDTSTSNENLIGAAADGAKTGLRLAANVGAMLLAFISLVDLANFLVSWCGDWVFRILSDATGFGAFQSGFIFGGLVGFVLLARWGWRGRRTKFWIGGLLTALSVPLLTSMLVRSVIYPKISFADPFHVILVAGGIILGLFLSYIPVNLESNLTGKFYSSLLIWLGIATGVGLLTLLVGGRSSVLYARISCSFFMGLIPGLFYYWYHPSELGLRRASAILLVLGLLAFILLQGIGVDALWLLENLTLERLFGYVFSCLAFLMGVPLKDVVHFGELIGHKVVVNEFVAFQRLQTMAQEAMLSSRSLVIASYALCGFANFSSIAIQIGGIGGIAPDRQSELAKLGLRTMVCGALASFQTAAVAGLMHLVAQKMGINLVSLSGF